MNTTNLIQLARDKKQQSILTYLNRAFKDFAYPVYLFGSYSTGQFHGNSDVDILIIASDALSKNAYRLACNQLTDLGMNYDILVTSSINRLDSSIVTSLQAIPATAPCVALPSASMPSNKPQQPPSTSRYRRQSGMTLIEIMISLLIGAFLLGGILEIFINSRQTYRMQEGLSRLQENGRFATELISKSIRMTGYWACLSSTNITNVAGANNNNNNNAVTGYNIDENNDNINDGTDTLTLKGAFVQTPTVTCGNAVDTAAAYYTDASSTIIYTINKAALYQNTNGQNNSLIEGIQDMQILYGADTNADNTPDYYVAAGTTGLNMAQVVSIRISLLGVTLDNNLTAQPVPYTYNGATTTPIPTDRKIRRVFNTTIAVRNRLP